MRRMARSSPRGFTLIELLAVIAIIGVLVALLLPAIQASRESSRRTQCQNNLREIGIALALHANATGGFPIGCMGCSLSSPDNRRISWNVRALPFLEQTSLESLFDFSAAASDSVNQPVRATIVELFLCPSTLEDVLRFPSGSWQGSAFTDYGGVYGVEGIGRDLVLTASGEDDVPASETGTTFQTLRDDSLGVLLYEVSVTSRMVTDGLSKTVCVAELARRRQSQETVWVNGHNVVAQEQSTPLNGTGLADEIGSPHPGGANLAFCDGHVQFVDEHTEQDVLNATLTKAGGETP